MRRDYLFSEATLRDALDRQGSAAREAVETIEEGELRTRPVEELAAEIRTKFAVVPVHLAKDRIEVSQSETQIDVRGDPGRYIRDTSRPFFIPAVAVKYHVPFEGDAELFRLRPSTYTNLFPTAAIDGRELVFQFDVEAKDVSGTKRRFEHEMALVERYLEYQRTELDTFDKALEPEISAAIRRRRERLDIAKSGLDSFGFPIRTVRTSTKESTPNSAPPPPEERDQVRRYEVALSFAGEDRAYVDEVARLLKERGVDVFYDRFETAELWGKNLIDHLTAIYGDRSRFVVIFVSAAYAAKPWTNVERKAAQAKAFMKKEEMILPARFDDTELPGLPTSVGYIDLRTTNPGELVDLIMVKLGAAKKAT